MVDIGCQPFNGCSLAVPRLQFVDEPTTSVANILAQKKHATRHFLKVGCTPSQDRPNQEQSGLSSGQTGMSRLY